MIVRKSRSRRFYALLAVCSFLILFTSQLIFPWAKSTSIVMNSQTNFYSTQTAQSRSDSADTVEKPTLKPDSFAGVETDNTTEVSTDNATQVPASNLPFCWQTPPTLTGRINQSMLRFAGPSEADVIRRHTDVALGGVWRPTRCRSRHKVAIIFPFRDRKSHLNMMLDYLIPVLQRQQLDFRIIVAEQYGKDLFNKGRILNAAFAFAERLGVQCVVFHDVDMFPQDDRISYACPPSPRHIGAYVDTLRYELWYHHLVGGVLAFRMEHYRQVNGYSNSFWGWGGEDDDMGYRILANKLVIDRQAYYYTMLNHTQRRRQDRNMIMDLLKTSKTRWRVDGLKNSTAWRIVTVKKQRLFYHVYIDVGKSPKEWRRKAPNKTPTLPASTNQSSATANLKG